MVGLMVTVTKTNMLSFAGILMLENVRPGVPSTLILNWLVPLPVNFMEEIMIGWLLGFLTKNALTVEPTVVNTVSNKTESVEKASLAPGLVITVSFLHEKIKTAPMHKARKREYLEGKGSFLYDKIFLLIEDTNAK